jgi:hypothetical protein
VRAPAVQRLVGRQQRESKAKCLQEQPQPHSLVGAVGEDEDLLAQQPQLEQRKHDERPVLAGARVVEMGDLRRRARAAAREAGVGAAPVAAAAPVRAAAAAACE